MMKNHTLCFILFVFVFTGCTQHFRSLNTDRTGITQEDMTIDFNHIGIPLNIIQEGIYFNYDFGKGKNWPYQLIQNLNADMFSGYMHDYKPLNGGSHNSDYNLQEGWNASCWQHVYAYIFPEIKRLEDSTIARYPPFYAVTKILKVLVMHRVSDYYGPVIYSNFGNKRIVYTPDAQEDVYKYFFDDLDEATELLEQFIQEYPQAKEFANLDILLDGKYSTWIKFANSLRLRLAIRIAMAAPEKAKEEVRKSLKHPYGVFENPHEIAAVSTKKGYTNPLGEINRSWGEVFMNASMESILNGYEDPRREVFFEPCEDDIRIPADRSDSIHIQLKGKYKGIRQGTMFAHTYYHTHSRMYINPSSPANLMTAAEIWFLRAEAALREWTEEDAGTCYQEGVRTSFTQWNVPGAEVYLQNDRIGADYTDALDPDNNIKARCLVSPRWVESADPEIKLEKIITQKWLAIFPEGCEAWAEQRRTGYPRLFPVRFNNSPDHCIDTEIMIRRLNFPYELMDKNPELYQMLTRLLNGPNHAGTRLWWDTGKNF